MNCVFRRVVPAATATAAVSLAFALNNNHKQTNVSCEEEAKRPKLIFLGTGSSTGCPKPLCTMLFQDNNKSASSLSESQQEFVGICRVSNLAIQGNPRDNKDYRNNPSLLIHYYTKEGDSKNIVIDVGKTFREGALRWFPTLGIQTLDAIVLTHHHMDAVAGLDDVRGFQRFSGLNRNEPPRRIPISVFLSQECLDQVSSQFPWLFPNQQITLPTMATTYDKPQVKRDVAALDVNVIQDYQPFTAAGLEMVPLPVWHGSDLISLGFSFSIPGKDGTLKPVVYISDISKMVPETLEYIKKKLPPTSILIVDCLLPEFQHPVHYSLEQAVALSQEIQAQQTFLIGMSCDAFLPHDEMNAQLTKKYKGTIQFAHDGKVLYL